MTLHVSLKYFRDHRKYITIPVVIFATTKTAQWQDNEILLLESFWTHRIFNPDLRVQEIIFGHQAILAYKKLFSH